MAEDQIYVDGDIFLGRAVEQTQFRQVLLNVLNSEPGDGPPHVFVVHGPAGSGKSKLVRRLRDIAARESPFEATTQTILVDWELARLVEADGSPGEDPARAIFGYLYRAARDAGWGHQFPDYQGVLRQLNRAEKKVAEAFEQEGWSYQFPNLQDMEPGDLARLLRLNDQPLGHEQPVSIPDGLGRVYRQADRWLSERVQLESDEEEIYRQPNCRLAEQLGLGLGKLARTKPLILLQDAFGHLHGNDPWIRAIMHHAGPRVIWVIAGEGELAGQPTVVGGPALQEEFGSTLVVFEPAPLVEDHLARYLQNRSPDRMVTRNSVEQIYQVIQGKALAVQLVGDLWAGGVPIHEITKNLNSDMDPTDIMTELSQRLLTNCDDPQDYRALVFLGIQPRPNEDVLAGVLGPQRGSIEMRERLKQLRTRYRALQTEGEVVMHSTVAMALARHLLRRRIRLSDDVKQVAEKASDVSGKMRDELEAGFPRLEDRFESTEWREVVLDNLFWLFLKNEYDAWRQVNRDFVDALGYDLNMARSLLGVMEQVEPILTSNGIQRLRTYQAGLALQKRDGRGPGQEVELDEEISLLTELERWLTRYGGKEMFSSERRAILDVRRGEVFLRYERYEDALNLFLKAEKNLPNRGESLLQQLAKAYERVGSRLAWQWNGEKFIGVVPSPAAETSLKKAISLGRRRARNYHALGAVQEVLGKLNASLENLLQAVTLNPEIMEAWYRLGEVYRKQELVEKAVPAYRRAIELESRNVRARLSLAVCYRLLEQHQEFAREVQAIRGMVDEGDLYYRACVEGLSGPLKTTLELLYPVLRRKLVSRETVLQEPCFDFIRSDPAFHKLLDSV